MPSSIMEVMFTKTGRQGFHDHYIYREGNEIADVWPNTSCILCDFKWWYRYPFLVANFAFRARNDLSNFRFH